MKTKLTTSFVLLLLVVCYLFTGSAPDKQINTKSRIPLRQIPTTGGGDNFIFSAFDTRWDLNFKYISDTLGFNLWHRYADSHTAPDGRTIPDGWTSADSLHADISDYKSQVQGVLSDIKTNNMTALMMRPKVEWLCFGQRSDYQCEPVPLSDDLWFYSFNNNETGDTLTDYSSYGNGEKVMYCEAGMDPAEYVVKRLKANSEQCRGGGKDFHADSKQTWLIKPRIRIDSMFARTNPEDSVCRVKIIGSNGSTVVKETVIKAKYFKDVNGNYDGSYKEEFNFGIDPVNLSIFGDWGDSWTYSARGTSASDGSHNKADIQVYWYDNCDMWIDYVRVDNDVADELFKGVRDPWLEWEAKDIACYDNGSSAYRFYIEWFEFNNIPCIKYVNKKLDSISNANCSKRITILSLHNYYAYGAHVPWADRFSLVNAAHYKKHYLDSVGVSEICIPNYPFTSKYNFHHGGSEPKPYTSWSKIPNTLPTIKAGTDGDGTLAYPVSPAAYDDWLQNWLDSVPNTFETGYDGPFKYTSMQDQGGFRYVMQQGDSLSKQTGLPFLLNPQIHIWKKALNPTTTGEPSEVQREPTVEETDMVANVGLTYGVKGLIYFRYTSYNNTIPDTFYDRGIVFNNNAPRYLNIYGQEKWKGLIEQSKRLKRWEPYIMSFNDADRQSYIYRFSAERNAMATNTFISSMRTYPPIEFAPDPIDPDLDNLPPDTLDNVYLQAGFFKIDGETDVNKYFMIVNRRCSPYVDSANLTNLGGRKLVAFYPNAAKLPGFNNWKVIDLEDSSTVWTFDKNSSAPIYIGDFMPGEGKLFKLSPVMQEGGTLVGNELIDGQTFECKGEVLNNGKDITIKSSTISFADSGKITMSEGIFKSGLNTTPYTTQVTYKAKSSETWDGISLTNCSDVQIYNTKFEGLENSSGKSLLKLTDCYVSQVSHNTFDITTNTNAMAIYANYTFTEEPKNTPAPVFLGNTFNTNGNKVSTMKVVSSAAQVISINIEGNYFYSNKPEPSAIFLTNTVGGAIKNNTISGYGKGIQMISSSMDLYGNNINSGLQGYGIYASTGSIIGMKSSGIYFTGGSNIIKNTGDGVPNIYVQSSEFRIKSGGNTFDIETTDTNHLSGYFPASGFEPWDTDAKGNCFKLNSVDSTARSDVLDGNGGTAIAFVFTPYSCNGGEGASQKGIDGNGSLTNTGDEDYIVIPVTDNYNDTIYTNASGTSGAMDTYDKLNLQTRKRNYDSVIVLAKDILDSASESENNIDAIQKLYLAVLKSDSANIKMTDLKAYYEQLILDNESNTALIDRSFYYLQKCKVSLGEYQSAMNGFTDIINQNPYTYEALIASWDYSATSLLMGGSGGSSGSEVSIFDDQLPMFNNKAERLFELKSFNDDEPLNKKDKSSNNESKDKSSKDKYDEKKFTKEDRQTIKKHLKQAFEDKRTKKLKEVKELEEKSLNGDEKAKKELKKVKTLEEAVKLKKPRDITEHIDRVNSDINMVFGQGDSDGAGIEVKEVNFLPDDYELSQNYPNPFNPVTKIKYALPQDSRVSIVVYDILGREVTKLVNSELRPAGRYTVDFNGSGLSSGIYFYRIQANDFIQVKRMVLIK